MSIYIFTESFTLSRGIIYAVQEVPSLKPGYETVHQLREAFKERNFNDFKEELMSVQTRHLSDGLNRVLQIFMKFLPYLQNTCEYLTPLNSFTKILHQHYLTKSHFLSSFKYIIKIGIFQKIIITYLS